MKAAVRPSKSSFWRKCLRALTEMAKGRAEWKKIEYFDVSWRERIREMAQYISPGESVLDLGCGPMWLRDYLSHTVYWPVDYKRRGEDTIIADFTKHEFPANYADVAFVSGTLEYVPDPEWFVGNVATHARKCIVSYCLTEYYPVQTERARLGWINHLSRSAVIGMFEQNEMSLNLENLKIRKQSIFVFTVSEMERRKSAISYL